MADFVRIREPALRRSVTVNRAFAEAVGAEIIDEMPVDHRGRPRQPTTEAGRPVLPRATIPARRRGNPQVEITTPTSTTEPEEQS